MTRAILGTGPLAIVAGIALCIGHAGAAASAPFPDVPPWHWAHDAVLKDQEAGMFVGYPATPAEFAQTSVTQVYEGFTHSGATGAQEWVERFSYNRPSTWPAPLQRSQIAQFTLRGMKVAVGDDTATATFTAAVTTRQGQVVTTPMRVALRHNGQDWQVDYATLQSGSALFR